MYEGHLIGGDDVIYRKSRRCLVVVTDRDPCGELVSARSAPPLEQW
jgi:hypothetical protein